MINLSFDELRQIAQIRNISDSENKSKEDLIKALSERKPDRKPKPNTKLKPDTKPKPQALKPEPNQNQNHKHQNQNHKHQNRK